MADTITQPDTDLPPFDPALMSEAGLLALAAQSAAPETDPTPVPPPAPAAPVPAASLSPAPASAPAAPVADPAAQPAAPAAAEPAPAEPAASDALRPDLAKNYRVTAQNAVEQTALQIRRADPSLSLMEALVKAHAELGLPSPVPAAPVASQAPAASTPEPEPQVSPLDKIKGDIQALDQKLNDLHPTFDAEEFKTATLQRQNLLTEQVRLETDARIQEQLAAQSAQVEIQRAQAQVNAQFGDILADAQHPFTLAYQAQLNHLLQTAPDEIVGAQDFELRVAAELADRFEQTYKIPVRKASAAPAPAPAPAPVTQQPAPAAAPQPQAPAAQPRSAAVPLSGAPASVNPVMGIDRPDPSASINGALQGPAVLDPDSIGDSLLAAAYGGHVAPPPATFRMAA